MIALPIRPNELSNAEHYSSTSDRNAFQTDGDRAARDYVVSSLNASGETDRSLSQGKRVFVDPSQILLQENTCLQGSQTVVTHASILALTCCGIPQKICSLDGECRSCGRCEEVSFCRRCNTWLCGTCWTRWHGLPQDVPAIMGTGHNSRDLQLSVFEEVAKHFDGPTSRTPWLDLSNGPNATYVLENYDLIRFVLARSPPPCLKERTPKLVSFTGYSGSGKSTILRMLVEQRFRLMMEKVHNNASLRAGMSPSSDLQRTVGIRVHIESETSHLQDPIIYADCEGFGHKSRNASSTNDVQEPSAEIGLEYVLTKKVLARTCGDFHDAIECVLEQVYPMLLYICSEVLVFVTKCDTMDVKYA